MPANVTCNSPGKRSPCYRANSMLLVAILLLQTGCLKRYETADYSTIPPWPTAGEAVATELQTIPPDNYPALYNWLGRLLQYKNEMDIITEKRNNALK